jgi:hypothetical protein
MNMDVAIEFPGHTYNPSELYYRLTMNRRTLDQKAMQITQNAALNSGVHCPDIVVSIQSLRSSISPLRLERLASGTKGKAPRFCLQPRPGGVDVLHHFPAHAVGLSAIPKHDGAGLSYIPNGAFVVEGMKIPLHSRQNGDFKDNLRRLGCALQLGLLYKTLQFRLVVHGSPPSIL